MQQGGAGKMTNYQSGARLERLWMHQMKLKGYCVMRSAGSKGLVDCSAWNTEEEIKAQIKTNNQEMTWYVTQGKTIKSLYGQLMALGKYKGKLIGEKVTLSVTSTKNKEGKPMNSYQIIEAVQILPILLEKEQKGGE